MSADAVRRVDVGGLRQGAVLGAGGQGQVVAVDYQVDGKWPAVLKTYKSSVSFDPRVLEKLVAFPSQLSDRDRDWLMETSAWPWAVAEGHGIPCGLLMRAVPRAYEFSFATVTQGGNLKLSAVEFLLNSDSYTRKAGILISERDRLEFLRGLAETVSRLHSLGVVVGDLSPKNLLFNSNSYSQCFLIDCDAVALQGESALEQTDTPDWEIPASERKGTQASDAFKFGLLAIRLFARDQSSHDVSAISAVSPVLGQLATQSQVSDPLSRPSPGSWMSAIQSAITFASSATATSTAVPRPGPAHPPSRAGGSRQYQPVGAQARPAPPARQRGNTGRAVGLSLAALLVVGLIFFGVDVSHHHAASLTSGSGATAESSASQIPSQPAPAAPSSAPATVPQAAQVGIVTVSDQLSSNSEAMAVAQLFNTYFSGINSKDYQQALSSYDPSGIVDPNNSSQAQHFIDGVSTSSDSNVKLISVDPADGSTVQSAELKFTSHQAPGYGPTGNSDEKCTDWDISYVLTEASPGEYLIKNISGATDSRC